jgi:NAD-dependent deacetylase
MIFVGTSFSVGVTANLLEIAGDRGVPVWNIDPGGDRPAPSVRVLPMRAEEALPELVALCRR